MTRCEEELQNHDVSPFSEVDQSHLCALPELLLLGAGGKERYVCYNMYGARRAFRFPSFFSRHSVFLPSSHIYINLTEITERSESRRET